MTKPVWLLPYLDQIEAAPPSEYGLAAGGLIEGMQKSSALTPRPARAMPRLTVVINNYNGALWLERCLTSLHTQTVADELEIIVADDASTDESAALASSLMQDWPNARVLRNDKNLGYCELNNRAVESARGRYLFFLNNDAWLEPDCLERLLHTVQDAVATVATPLVLDYQDNTVQTAGEAGFDIFGFMSHQTNWSHSQEVFVAAGCCLLIETSQFRMLGGFDSRFRVFADEYDLCWRAWLTGGKVILDPSARVHHRGGAGVNPQGRERLLDNRTSDTKRYLANRNGLLVLLKNAEHLLLLLVPLQLASVLAEAVAMGVWTRRWSHVQRSYLNALVDCWRMRRHIFAERRRLRSLRRHGDLWMLRFLRGQINRWGEVRRFWRFRDLKVDPK